MQAFFCVLSIFIQLSLSASNIYKRANNGFIKLVDCLANSKTYEDEEKGKGDFTRNYTVKTCPVSETKSFVTNLENGAGPTLDIVEPTDAYSPATVAVTIKQDSQYTTMTSPYALDFTNSDVKACVATDLTRLDAANALGILLDKVTLTQVQKVPAGTGIVVRAADKLAATETFQIPVVSDDEAANIAAIDTNYMAPVLTKTYIGGNYKYWIDESCAFHRKKSDDFVLSYGLFSPSKPGYLAAGKSYLVTPYSYEDGGEKYIENYNYDAPSMPWPIMLPCCSTTAALPA